MHNWAKLARWRRIRRWTTAALLLTGLAACQGQAGLTWQPVIYGVPSSSCSPRWADLIGDDEDYGQVVMTCVGWELDVPFGMDVELRTAVSGVNTGGDVPFEISSDGHRVAYLDSKQFRYLAKDLRTGSTRPLTPRLTAEEIVGLTTARISADGRYYAVSTREHRRTYMTDFETGQIRTVPQVCWSYGLTSELLMGSGGCNGWNVAIDTVRFDGTATRFLPEEKAPRDMSPDLRWYIDNDDPYSIYETASKRKVRTFLYGLDGMEWADSDTLVARDHDFVAIDATTGERIEIGIPYEDPIAFGKVR